MTIKVEPMAVLSQAKQWIAGWARLWKLPNLEGAITIEFSSRFKSSLGRSYPERGLIRLHTQLRSQDEEDALREVLCHEAAHIAAFAIHGLRVRPHGTEWQDLVRRAGFEPRVRAAFNLIPPVPRPSWASILPFEHRCPVCHAVRFARRRMQSWRCAECVTVGLDGVMAIVQQPRGK